MLFELLTITLVLVQLKQHQLNLSVPRRICWTLSPGTEGEWAAGNLLVKVRRASLGDTSSTFKLDVYHGSDRLGNPLQVESFDELTMASVRSIINSGSSYIMVP